MGIPFRSLIHHLDLLAFIVLIQNWFLSWEMFSALVCTLSVLDVPR
jgi:hypothetical protein